MNETSAFRLGEGGLLNRFFAKTRLASPSIPGIAARVVAALLLMWLPLLIASAIQGLAWGHAVQVPFLHDPASQARFLVAMPLLFIAEPVLARGLGAVVLYLENSGLIPPAERGKLRTIVDKGNRWLSWISPEFLIVAAVVALAVTHSGAGRYEQFSAGVSNWGIDPANGGKNWAGHWYYSVSLPIYRFLMLRWIWRYLVWSLMLLKISRLRLMLMPSHPDLAGGLGFLAVGQRYFGILAFAFGAQLSGLFARKAAFEGQDILGFLHPVLAYVTLATLLFLAPLLFFLPAMRTTKRRGLMEFGALGEKYAMDFERKWIRKSESPGEPLLGSGDIQSLADLANSFDVVRRMRLCPFDWRTTASLFGGAALPFLPLLFFIYRFDEILLRTFQLIF